MACRGHPDRCLLWLDCSGSVVSVSPVWGSVYIGRQRAAPGCGVSWKLAYLSPAMPAASRPSWGAGDDAFDVSFDPTYRKIREVADAIGRECRRADNIWAHNTVIQDVTSLIDRSAIVVCGLHRKERQCVLRSRDRTRVWPRSRADYADSGCHAGGVVVSDFPSVVCPAH